MEENDDKNCLLIIDFQGESKMMRVPISFLPPDDTPDSDAQEILKALTNLFYDGSPNSRIDRATSISEDGEFIYNRTF